MAGRPAVVACENRAPSQHTRPLTLPTHGAPSGAIPMARMRLEMSPLATENGVNRSPSKRYTPSSVPIQRKPSRSCAMPLIVRLRRPSAPANTRNASCPGGMSDAPRSSAEVGRGSARSHAIAIAQRLLTGSPRPRPRSRTSRARLGRDPLHAGSELAGGDRLLELRRTELVEPLARLRGERAAGQKDQPLGLFGRHALELLDQLDAGHVRHHHVADDR